MKAQESNARGSALVIVLIVFAFLLALGFGLVGTTQTSFQMSGAYRDMTEARYLAEAGIQQVTAYQNDATRSPRYLFNTSTYSSTGDDPLFKDFTVLDPENSNSIGTVARRVVGGRDPFTDLPPYRVQSTATVRGATRTLEAEVAPLSLLEYALWTETSVSIAPFITYTGKVYSATSIDLGGYPITFDRKVEYVTTLNNPANGIYNDEVVRLTAAKTSLTTLVDLNFYRNASRGPGVCDVGDGLFIGTGQPHTALFQRSAGVYQIDLGLFDLSGPFKTPPEAIRYNGTELTRFADPTKKLTDFNGIIYVDGELRIWGINGGRSIEDYARRDRDTGNPAGSQYLGPLGQGYNVYSNYLLDPGEDGDNGGVVNGILDPKKLGRSLTIVTATTRDIWIEHNIAMGQDWTGRPVRTALISGRAVHISTNAPKTIKVWAALMALGTSTCPSGGAGGNSWEPCSTTGVETVAHNGHLSNYWAQLEDGSYKYDLDHDDTLESNNGSYQAADRNETAMFDAYSLEVLGNRIFKGTPSSGHWASHSHPRFYSYDDTLVIYEPPCYPILPVYDLVAGSVTEIR